MLMMVIAGRQCLVPWCPGCFPVPDVVAPCSRLNWFVNKHTQLIGQVSMQPSL